MLYCWEMFKCTPHMLHLLVLHAAFSCVTISASSSWRKAFSAMAVHWHTLKRTKSTVDCWWPQLSFQWTRWWNTSTLMEGNTRCITSRWVHLLSVDQVMCSSHECHVEVTWMSCGSHTNVMWKSQECHVQFTRKSCGSHSNVMWRSLNCEQAIVYY